MNMSEAIFIDAVKQYLMDLQDRICNALVLEETDGSMFNEDSWDREAGGGGRSRVLEGGAVYEKASARPAP